MQFKSLKTRIILFVTGIVVVSLFCTTFFLVQKAKKDLSIMIDENAHNLMEATLNNVRSQYNSIVYHKAVMLQRRKVELKNNMAIAMSVVNSAFEDFKQGRISEQEARHLAIEGLENIRYDKGIGYFWINDVGQPYPKMIMHPIMPELDNQVLDDPKFQCVIGSDENLFKMFVNICQRKGEGFVNYLWPKPLPDGLTEQQPKLSFIRMFEPWQWIIGTGIYIDDIDKDVDNRIKAVINDLNQIILDQKIGNTGYFFIFDEQNNMLVHPSLAGRNISNMIDRLSGKPIAEELKETAISSKPFLEYLWDKPGYEGDFKYLKKVYVAYFEPLGWYICTSVYQEDIDNTIFHLTDTIIGFSAIFLILAIIISLVVSNSITNPLRKLVRSIRQRDVDGIPQNRAPEMDIAELQLLARTINNMIDSISASRLALRQSEAKFRALVESSSDWIWEVNDRGEYTYSSPQVKFILGYTPQSVMGKTPIHFLPSKDVKKVTRIYRRLFSKATPIIMSENTCISKTGERVVLETSGVPFFDEAGKFLGYRGVARNITDRKLAESALLASEEKFRLLADNSFDIIWRMNMDGQFTYVNPAVEALSGFSQDEVLSMTMQELLVPESIEWVQNYIREQLSLPIKKREKALVREFKQYKKDGSIIDIEVSATWIYDQAGNAIAIQGINRDITDRKRTEEQIRRDLVEKEVMLKEIHHRVKNNLAVITGLLYLQSKRIKSKEEAFAAFEESRSRIFSMAMVHEELYNSGDLSMIDMNSYVKRITGALTQTYAQDNQISLKLDIHDVILNVNHAVPCGLILSELISNAYKHAFPDDRTGQIKIIFKPFGKSKYRLTVQDNGIGLSDEIDTSSDKTLGLYLITMLTKQIDGELLIKRLKGTRFTITFPA